MVITADQIRQMVQDYSHHARKEGSRGVILLARMQGYQEGLQALQQGQVLAAGPKAPTLRHPRAKTTKSTEGGAA